MVRCFAILYLLFVLVSCDDSPIAVLQNGINTAPSINGTGAVDTLPPLQETTLNITVTDSESNSIDYLWLPQRGGITGSGASVRYTAPLLEGDDTVTVIAYDNHGGADTTKLILPVYHQRYCKILAPSDSVLLSEKEDFYDITITAVIVDTKVGLEKRSAKLEYRLSETVAPDVDEWEYGEWRGESDTVDFCFDAGIDTGFAAITVRCPDLSGDTLFATQTLNLRPAPRVTLLEPESNINFVAGEMIGVNGEVYPYSGTGDITRIWYQIGTLQVDVHPDSLETQIPTSHITSDLCTLSLNVTMGCGSFGRDEIVLKSVHNFVVWDRPLGSATTFNVIDELIPTTQGFLFRGKYEESVFENAESVGEIDREGAVLWSYNFNGRVKSLLQDSDGSVLFLGMDESNNVSIWRVTAGTGKQLMFNDSLRWAEFHHLLKRDESLIVSGHSSWDEYPTHIVVPVSADTTGEPHYYIDTTSAAHEYVELVSDGAGGFYRAISPLKDNEDNVVVERLNESLEVLWSLPLVQADGLPTNIEAPYHCLTPFNGGVVVGLVGSVDTTDFFNDYMTSAKLVAINGSGTQLWKRDVRRKVISNYHSAVEVYGTDIITVGVSGEKTGGTPRSKSMIFRFDGTTGALKGGTYFGNDKSGIWLKTLQIEGNSAYLAGFQGVDTYDKPYRALLKKVDLTHEVMMTKPSWVRAY